MKAGPLLMGRPRDFSKAQLLLIRQTIARACNDAEFDEFIAVAFQSGLDPLRRQIAPLIVDAHAPERRRLIPWATIDGLRVLAARQGDYRPMETAPLLESDAERVHPLRNPIGLIRAEVRAWKYRDTHWHPVVGEAWWDEYAPLRQEWVTEADGERRSGEQRLEASWMRMGRVMLAKCAEAQALRRGWPDTFSGLYGEEEIHGLRLREQTASEILKASGSVVRRCGAGAVALWIVFEVETGPEPVQCRALAERLHRHVLTAASAGDIEAFLTRNRESLQLFWEWSPTAAFAFKRIAETRMAALARRDHDLGRANLCVGAEDPPRTCDEDAEAAAS